MARSWGQRRSKKQEERAAAAVGGRTTSGSGSVESPSQKGDVRKQFDLRLECKTTDKQSYSLKLSDWRKIQSQAGQFGETPAMQIQFAGAYGMHTKLAVIDWATFEQLRDRLEVLEEPI